MLSLCLFCIRCILLILLMPNIIVHELGHFLLALALGFPVKSFDIGSGEILCQYSLGTISFKVCEKIDGASVTINSIGKTYQKWKIIAL
ncbi:site-2 protease family protein [Propionispora vibrioides]|uniref:site-2 protease family protein n=1 Tax=Propionispora vibrioides TaxID=112903 RepID=UPI000B87D3FA